MQGNGGETREYGVETLVMDDESREDVEEYLCQQLAESAETIE